MQYYLNVKVINALLSFYYPICFLLILIQGGSIAAAWVSMRALGVDGYTSKAKDLMETTDKLKKGIAEIDVCFF